jgi:hypothetical protein
LDIKIYKIRIVHLLFGCVTWSFTLREEHRLRDFENRELRRICGLKREEVAGAWKRIHSEQLHNLYTSSYGG